MFSGQPCIRSALRLGVYTATIVAVTALTGWSAYRVGATIVALLDAKIVDGSGRAMPEPEWSAPPLATDPRTDLAKSSDTTTTAVSHLTSAEAGPLVTPPRASSDEPENDPAAAFHDGDEDTYKTYCVRLCDGSYRPISFSTTPDKFDADAAACQSSCNSPARLFVHPIPGGGPATMVSLDGVPYTALKTAFLFRTRYDAQCRCHAQPWEEAAKDRHKLFAAAEAVKNGDQTAIAEALRLRDKVAEETRAQITARAAAEKSVERELTKLSRTASIAPPERPQKRRRTTSNRKSEIIRLGAVEPDPPQSRGFVAASGPGRNWKDRAFGD